MLSSLPSAVLQADATGGGPLAVVVTFLLTALFYAVTLHLAATFFIGDVPSQRAAYAALAPALVSILLQQYGQSGGVQAGPLQVGQSLLVALTLVVTLFTDLLSISLVYKLKFRSAAPLVALHFAFAAVIGILLANAFGVL